MPTTEGEAGMPQSYPHGPPPSQQQHPGLPPHQQRYAAHYAGHPPPPHMPPPPPGPYYGGPPPGPGQYGTPSTAPQHPHQWSGGMPQGPPPNPGQAPAYPNPSQRSLSPERPGNWNYRNSAPHKPRSKAPKPDKEEDGQYWPHGQPHGPPPPYHSPSYGPPPPGWQGNHPAPPLHPSGPPPPAGPAAPHMGYSSWGGKTPPRRPRDPYASNAPPSRQHDMDMPLYMGSSRGHPSAIDDDCASSSAADTDKDKGRGSYKCGRCGVPKKGHVCPYQPKLKRRDDEPAPDTRHAAVQVEMDEFMTLRRLNIRIQGFPESYVTEPYMSEMVVGEPSIPMSMPPPMEMSHGSSMMPEVEQRMTVETINDEPSRRHSNSPMRDSAVGDGNLNHDVSSSPEVGQV